MIGERTRGRKVTNLSVRLVTGEIAYRPPCTLTPAGMMEGVGGTPDTRANDDRRRPGPGTVTSTRQVTEVLGAAASGRLRASVLRLDEMQGLPRTCPHRT